MASSGLPGHADGHRQHLAMVAVEELAERLLVAAPAFPDEIPIAPFHPSNTPFRRPLGREIHQVASLVVETRTRPSGSRPSWRRSRPPPRGERRARPHFPSPRGRSRPTASTSPVGASRSSSSWTWRIMPARPPGLREAAVDRHHGELDQVGGGPLDRRVDRDPLGELAHAALAGSRARESGAGGRTASSRSRPARASAIVRRMYSATPA